MHQKKKIYILHAVNSVRYKSERQKRWGKKRVLRSVLAPLKALLQPLGDAAASLCIPGSRGGRSLESLAYELGMSNWRRSPLL